MEQEFVASLIYKKKLRRTTAQIFLCVAYLNSCTGPVKFDKSTNTVTVG
jgi:hypothetical protein